MGAAPSGTDAALCALDALDGFDALPVSAFLPLLQPTIAATDRMSMIASINEMIRFIFSLLIHSVRMNGTLDDRDLTFAIITQITI